MYISLISGQDDITGRIRRKIVPLLIDSLEKTDNVDYAFRKSVISRLRGRGYDATDEHVVMSISFDPKLCKTPKEYCSGDCKGCCYNPLEGLLDPFNTEGPFIITSRDTISTLLDAINILANANKNAVLRIKNPVEHIYE